MAKRLTSTTLGYDENEGNILLAPDTGDAVKHAAEALAFALADEYEMPPSNEGFLLSVETDDDGNAALVGLFVIDSEDEEEDDDED